MDRILFSIKKLILVWIFTWAYTKGKKYKNKKQYYMSQLGNNSATVSHFADINNLVIVLIYGFYPRVTDLISWGVTLDQLVKASVGQAGVQRFESHLGHKP